MMSLVTEEKPLLHSAPKRGGRAICGAWSHLVP